MEQFVVKVCCVYQLKVHKIHKSAKEDLSSCGKIDGYQHDVHSNLSVSE